MMEKHRYKGMLIDSRAIPLRGGGWTTHYSVWQDLGSESLDHYAETGQEFATEKDALEFGVRLAVQKIDSLRSGCVRHTV